MSRPKFLSFLPSSTKIEAGHEHERIIVIGQINIQLNMAQGGGAKVEVKNG